MIRVFIVEDLELFASGIRTELGDAFEVVGHAGTVQEAVPGVLGSEPDVVPGVLGSEPDVVLLDVHLPDGSGASVAERVLAEREGVRFLALSVSDAAEDVIAVIRAGAKGYVTKSISPAELTDAIRRVHEGDVVFSPRLAGFVLDAFSGISPSADPELDQLTPREREVLRYIARGYSYKEIASELSISGRTVESHVSAVLRKLQLSSRYELSRWAVERRLT